MPEIQKVGLYRKVLAYARPYRMRIAVSMLASLVVAAGDGAMVKLVQPFVDDLIVAGDREMVKFVPVIVVGLSLAKAIGRYIQSYAIRTAGQLAIQDLRNDVFAHTMALSMRHHVKTSSGSMMSGILNDIGLLAQMLSETLVNALKEGVTLIVLIGVAIYTDWKMALIAFTVLPVSAIPAQMLARKIKKFVQRSQGAISILTTALEQAFSGIKVIKAFGSEHNVSNDFKQKNYVFYLLWRRSVSYDALSAAIIEITTSLGVAAVLWYGLVRVAAGELSQGELFSVVAAIVMMFAPVKRLTRVNNVFQSGMGAAERVFDGMELIPEIIDQPNAVDLERATGDLQLVHVVFSYSSDPEALAIKDFDLHIRPGEVVALVGPSGAGKTTLAGLLCRFYDPDSGFISLDGVDLRDLSSASLHKNITMVDQEAFLFNDSIANNIGYGRETTIDEIRAAARQAYADEFIEKLPDGYDTEIGDRGLRISGGQRQRICIARAICQDAPVLILDEATSALDTESEAIVQQAMQNLMKGRTSIVIAHRLSTIMNADKIVVMQAGKISEVGTHAQLLVNGGLYKKLYDMQFKDV